MAKTRIIIALAVASMGALAAAYKDKAILIQDGIHPAVARWYLDVHPDAFECADGEYGCAECPVGKPDRVVVIPRKSKAYAVPAEINAYFACDDINMLIPGPPRDGMDFDSFQCQREPADGYVIVDGRKFACSSHDISSGHTTDLETLNPGESKTITVTVPKAKP